MPKCLNFYSAASIPYVLMCAWDVLVTRGNIQPIQNGNNHVRVLICGGLRPIEVLSLQLAKL